MDAVSVVPLVPGFKLVIVLVDLLLDVMAKLVVPSGSVTLRVELAVTDGFTVVPCAVDVIALVVVAVAAIPGVPVALVVAFVKFRTVVNPTELRSTVVTVRTAVVEVVIAR